MPKIILKGHIVVSDAHLAAVMAELPIHIQLTREENGCLRFNVTQSQGTKNVFFVYEEFIDHSWLSNWGPETEQLNSP